MLRYRLASAAVLIPLILGAVLLGDLPFFALVIVALLAAGFEFFQMAQRAGHHPSFIIGLATVVLIQGNTFFRLPWLGEILTAALVVSLVMALFRRCDAWLLGWALTFAGALYVGVLGMHFILLRELPNGLVLTTLVLLTAWATDSFAYLAGHWWGRHRFFPSISPKKTLEGALGGEAAAIVVMLVLGTFFGLPPLHALILGFGIGIAATLGDLAESLVKRQLGAKDSGSTIPGHGGLLDRIDSLLFAAVFGYYYLAWIVRV